VVADKPAHGQDPRLAGRDMVDVRRKIRNEHGPNPIEVY
jgi:hypothetical protein